MQTLLLLSFFLSAYGYAETLLFKDVHLLNPETQKEIKTNILVENSKIKFIGISPPPLPKKLTTIKGGWVLPGFVDMHAHVTFGNPAPHGQHQVLTIQQVVDSNLYAGVVAVVDLFADEEQIFGFRDTQNSKGADLYAAGPMLTCSAGHGTEFGIKTRTMDTPKEAQIQIKALSQKKPDVIKITYDHARNYKSMNRETMAAAIKAAKAQKIKTIIHIGTWQDASEAVEAGADVITHLHDSVIPDPLVSFMKKKGAFEIPTMTYQNDYLNIIENKSLLSAPLLGQIIPTRILESYRQPDSQLGGLLGWQKRGKESYYQSLRKIITSGIPLMVGTDAGDVGVFHGFSVHREMAILVKAGLSPWKALASATSTSHRFLKRSLGIEKGDEASFVLLEESPLIHIENTQKIKALMHHGKLVDREALATSIRQGR